jgi:hypothetical protein
LLREDIMRLLAAGEDAGRSALTLWEVDDGLLPKIAPWQERSHSTPSRLVERFV